MKDFLKWIVTGIFLAIDIVLLATPSIMVGLEGVSWVMPIVLFLAILVGGYGLGELLTHLYVKRTEKETVYNV